MLKATKSSGRADPMTDLRPGTRASIDERRRRLGRIVLVGEGRKRVKLATNIRNDGGAPTLQSALAGGKSDVNRSDVPRTSSLNQPGGPCRQGRLILESALPLRNLANSAVSRAS